MNHKMSTLFNTNNINNCMVNKDEIKLKKILNSDNVNT